MWNWERAETQRGLSLVFAINKFEWRPNRYRAKVCAGSRDRQRETVRHRGVTQYTPWSGWSKNSQLNAIQDRKQFDSSQNIFGKKYIIGGENHPSFIHSYSTQTPIDQSSLHTLKFPLISHCNAMKTCGEKGKKLEKKSILLYCRIVWSSQVGQTEAGQGRIKHGLSLV